MIRAVSVLVIASIALAYWRGLDGGFVFDDFTNLNVLGAYGDVWRWPHFLYYLTSGDADPTGRPVAVLSFLLDGNRWPTDAWPFKRTNLVIHLINTGMLGWTIASLQPEASPLASDPASRRWVPLLAAAFWGAHPFFVSTTLYVVQREAMLPMSFILLAILGWQSAVTAFASGRVAWGWTWAVAGFGTATLLAGLSKANGFLAPTLVGLCYLYFLRPRLHASSRRRQADIASLLLLALPTLLLLAYLFQLGWHASTTEPMPGRSWTMAERLLTQPRAIWDYVARLAIPRAGGGGVFVEGFQASRGWWDPWTTMPAIVLLGLSTTLAWALRHHWPVASFAWLFFLSAHLLESTSVPLELYFEHRNYVPAIFLGWPAAQLLLMPGPQRRARTSLGVFLVLGLLLLTDQRASIWGDQNLMSALAASHETDSARAQISAAQRDLEQGNDNAAMARMRELLRIHPHSVDVAINAIGIECQSFHRLSLETLVAARHALHEASHWNFGLYVWLREAARTSAMRDCDGFGLEGLQSLVETVEINPHARSSSRQRDLKHVRGQIALALSDTPSALRWFDQALTLQAEAKYALVQAAALANAGDPARAIQHLDLLSQIETAQNTGPIRDMPALHRWLLDHYGYYDEEVADLRRRLERDIAKRTTRSGDSS